MALELEVQLAKELLDGPKTINDRDLARSIIFRCAEAIEVTIFDLVGPRRTRSLVRMRHLAMLIIRKRTELTHKEIGHLFGDRDHTTVIYAIESATQRLRRAGLEPALK